MTEYFYIIYFSRSKRCLFVSKKLAARVFRNLHALTQSQKDYFSFSGTTIQTNSVFKMWQKDHVVESCKNLLPYNRISQILKMVW